MRTVDFRSDAKTLPVPEMYEAIAGAVVGDDSDQEDPTICQLEALAAAKCGKEAGLLVVGGAMGNLVSVMAQCERGKEIILGGLNHHYVWECGSPAVIGGLSLRPVPNGRFGELPLDAVRAAIRPDDIHQPVTGLIEIENTHNHCGGTVLPLSYLAELRQLADEYGLPVHLDGARIFNAATYLGVEASEIARYADSVQICLTKGLCAPFGSVIVGKADFIERARRIRKLLGGGMRQAGIMAACGIVALEKMVGRLQEDHDNARRLAEGLAQIEGIKIDLDTVQTNIVMMRLDGDQRRADEFARRLSEDGVLVLAFHDGKIRFVTRYGITADDVSYGLAKVQKLMAA